MQCLISSGSSIVQAMGSYFRKQSSPLYIVDTVGKAVEVGYSTVGKVAIVNQN